MTGMAAVLPSLQEMLLRESQVTVEAAATLTYLYCVHKDRRVSAGVISHLLCHATSEAHLDTCLKMVDQLEGGGEGRDQGHQPCLQTPR